MAFSASGPAHATSYSTVFSLEENPVSEGGRWINGGVEGLDWSDVQTSPGRAFGTLAVAGYNDPTAILTGVWGPDQSVEATVFCANPTAAYHQEVELRVRSAIAPESATGYEVLFRCLDNEEAYVQIVRWNGPIGDFTSLASDAGAQCGVATGDVVKATIVGNVIKGFINGVEVASATDDTFTDGNPGMGFNYGVGGTYTDFGFTSWSATDSAGTPVETTCRFADSQSLVWDPVVEAMQYVVYRGELTYLTDVDGNRLPDGGYGACMNALDPDPTDTGFVDTDVPKEHGAGFFYLVGYVSGGAETGLGTNSAGLSRTVALSCP